MYIHITEEGLSIYYKKELTTVPGKIINFQDNHFVWILMDKLTPVANLK